MIGEQKPGVTELKELSLEQYNELKIRLSQNPDSDIREAYSIINKLENYSAFLKQEFETTLKDYNLEVFRSNELHKHLKTTIQLLKLSRER